MVKHGIPVEPSINKIRRHHDELQVTDFMKTKLNLKVDKAMVRHFVDTYALGDDMGD